MAHQNNVYKSIGLPDESHPLNVLPEGESLLTKAKRLRKTGGTGWNKPANFVTPSEAKRRREAGKKGRVSLPGEPSRVSWV